MKELDFNIGKSRTEFIGELVNASTNAFIHAKVKPQDKNIFRYYGYLSALHIELVTYVRSESSDETNTDDEEDHDFTPTEKVLEEVEDMFDDIGIRPEEDTDRYGDDDYNDALEKLEKVQKNLSELRMEIGLDIPSSSEVDPEDAGIEGL